MEITNWWPLAFLLLIPVIILLYMLKQKAKEYPFSSSILWKEIYHSVEATKPWEKLKKNILMILQILTVCLLIVALMAPYLKTGGKMYDNVILVLDTSASMGIRYNEKRTRMEEAVERACDYIDSLSETAQITVLTSNQEAGILKTNAEDKQALKKQLKQLAVTDLSGDATPAVSVVTSMVSQWDKYEAVFFTDAPLELGNLDATVVNLYTDYKNLSMDYLSYGSQQDEDGNRSTTVIGKITNDTEEAVTTDVNLYGDNTLLKVQSVTIPAKSSQNFFFEQIDFQGDILMAELNNQDDLSADNRAYAVVSAESRKTALLVTEDNMFLEKAISNMDWVDLYKTSQLSAVGKTESYDFYIFDGVIPEELPEQGNILYVNPPDGTQVTVKEKLSNVSLAFTDTEVTQYVAGFSFGATAAESLERPLWADSFLTSGDHCIGYYGEAGGRRIAVLGFDLHDSDLALQAEFPILISNLTEYMMVSGMVPQNDYETGDKIVFNGNLNGSDLTVTSPSGTVVTLPTAVTTNAYTDTAQAGVYSVAQTVNGEERQEQFVVRFPVEAESHLEEAAVEVGETAGEDNKNLTGGRELRNWIILILLLALGAEWFVYIRQH